MYVKHSTSCFPLSGREGAPPGGSGLLLSQESAGEILARSSIQVQAEPGGPRSLGLPDGLPRAAGDAGAASVPRARQKFYKCDESVGVGSDISGLSPQLFGK